MVSDVHPAQESDVSWLLLGLLERVPGARSAVLLSADGIPTAVHGLSPDDADHLSAIATGLFSMARSAATKFGGSDGVRQVVAELDDTLLFVCAAGFGSVLALLANREADAGVVGYEMFQLVKSVRPFLSTTVRNAGPGGEGPVA